MLNNGDERRVAVRKDESAMPRPVQTRQRVMRAIRRRRCAMLLFCGMFVLQRQTGRQSSSISVNVRAGNEYERHRSMNQNYVARVRF